MGQQFVRTVAVTDAINNARIGQLDKNQALLNTLVNAASAINRTSMGQLNTAAGLQQQKRQRIVMLDRLPDRTSMELSGLIGSI